MTSKELHEEIICIGNELKELKAKGGRLETKLEELKRAAGDSGGVFKPKYREEYWSIESDGGVYSEVWEDFNFDIDVYSMGNCFPTEQAAKDTVRVLKLIQKVRESQNGFVPDWEDDTQHKYTLHFKNNGIRVGSNFLRNIAPTLGYWGDKSACDEFITDNYDELVWFFKEHQR